MSYRIEIRPGDAAWPIAKPIFDAVWPPTAMATLAWRNVVFAHAERRVITLDADGNAVGHIGLYRRDMLWDGRSVRVGGIGGVATLPSHQGKGVASAALRTAANAFAADGLDVGLLFCAPDKFTFYTARGWHRFHGDVLMDQPSGRTRLTSMTPFVLDIRQAPRSGTFDLCGLPW